MLNHRQKINLSIQRKITMRKPPPNIENFIKKRGRAWPRMPSTTNPKMPKNHPTPPKKKTEIRLNRKRKRGEKEVLCKICLEFLQDALLNLNTIHASRPRRLGSPTKASIYSIIFPESLPLHRNIQALFCVIQETPRESRR